MLRILFFHLCALTLFANERPNILWITSEDNDKYWLGCYGNKQAKTPNIDALAERSIQFENFFSNAPVCAVARSTILTGIHAPSQGTQHMRSRHPLPTLYKPYVSYLREKGYYTTNNSKTDYNFLGNDQSLWHECGSQAHYKNRKDNQPFFAIFNLTESHESSLFASKIKNRRQSGALPPKPRVSPQNVQIRPYLPDLPAIRHDFAVYHDCITLLDTRVGEILQDLEQRNLTDNTIIFYYSDHGGVTPRGKRYLKDTGVNVPLLIHLPKKWQNLSPFPANTVTSEPASFVDLAPTLLSLVKIPKPTQMQGRAFLGPHREEPTQNEIIFLYADRFDELYGMRRGVTDGRWKYIRRFTPHQPAAPYSYYQFGQQAWKAWQDAWKKGDLKPLHSQIWEKNQAIEELFDTKNDRWEISNLATDPAYSLQLEKMRTALKKKMITFSDSGLIPEPMFFELAPKKPIAHYAQSRKESWPSLIDFAFDATSRNPDTLPSLLTKLSSTDPLERYWAAQGCLILGKKAQEAENPLRQLLNDPHSAIRAIAAQTLIGLGKPEHCFPVLLKELSNPENEYAQQNAVNIFTQIDALERIPNSWVKKSQGKDSGKYIQRLALKLAAERGL